MEIFKSFTFDAAHQLAANVCEGHKYAGIHGHSFEVELRLTGTPGADTGWVRDFAEIDAAIAPVRAMLDHAYLNQIAGLERPTLENLAAWIWQKAKPALPELSEIRVIRGSNREGCVYRGPAA
ncbi:MAG: 6-carboxytetrahydropterin synthase QueD [Sphingomonadales bacterium]